MKKIDFQITKEKAANVMDKVSDITKRTIEEMPDCHSAN